MSEVLTVREAELLVAESEQLQARVAELEPIIGMNDELQSKAIAAAERVGVLEERFERQSEELDRYRRRISFLTRERNEANDLDPDAGVVRKVFDHWRKRCNHMRSGLDDNRFATIKRGIQIASKIDEVEDPVTFCLRAVDGAAAFPFVVDAKRSKVGDPKKQRYDDIELILRNSKQIEKFAELGEQAGAQLALAADPVEAGPLDVAVVALRREYGQDLVRPEWNLWADPPVIEEFWSPCPLHPGEEGWRGYELRLRSAVAGVEFACINLCEPELVAQAVRDLGAAQAARLAVAGSPYDVRAAA